MIIKLMKLGRILSFKKHLEGKVIKVLAIYSMHPKILSMSVRNRLFIQKIECICFKFQMKSKIMSKSSIENTNLKFSLLKVLRLANE